MITVCPFVGDWIKLSIELAHGHRLGIDDVVDYPTFSH